jgi:hypothetical protein
LRSIFQSDGGSIPRWSIRQAHRPKSPLPPPHQEPADGAAPAEKHDRKSVRRLPRDPVADLLEELLGDDV